MQAGALPSNDEEQRRSSFGQSSAGGLHHPMTSTNLQMPWPAHRSEAPAPSLNFNQTPSTTPSAQNGVAAPSFASPENAFLYQMLQTMSQQMQQQQQFMLQVLQQQKPPEQHSVGNTELIVDALTGNITEFRFDVESGITFEAWFSRYEDLFNQDAARVRIKRRERRRDSDEIARADC